MEFPQFRIKVCGITSVADAEVSIAAGADALGLNFYPRSPRYLQPVNATAVAEAIPAEVLKVGLFVNATVSEVRAAQATYQLDVVQLHGDEPPEFLAELAGIPVMRAFRCGPDLSPVFEYLSRCRVLQAMPGAVLVDAYHPSQYGGTGQVADWGSIAALRDRWLDYHLVLAGGLTSGNVAAAIGAVRPDAVDTASGVESAPGKKAAEQVQAFVAAAAGAFKALASRG